MFPHFFFITVITLLFSLELSAGDLCSTTPNYSLCTDCRFEIMGVQEIDGSPPSVRYVQVMIDLLMCYARKNLPDSMCMQIGSAHKDGSVSIVGQFFDAYSFLDRVLVAYEPDLQPLRLVQRRMIADNTGNTVDYAEDFVICKYGGEVEIQLSKFSEEIQSLLGDVSGYNVDFRARVHEGDW